MEPGAASTNLLLAALSEADRLGLQPDITPVRFERGAVLCEPGVPLRHLYFPTTAVVSLLAVSGRGVATELALTGREGAVGVGMFLGGLASTVRAVAHVEGEVLRLSGARVASEFGRGGALQRILLRFSQALMAQISQAVVCNRHHSVEQALCRWLLMVRDRVGSDRLQVTQQLIADSLGVRREGITEAAGRLQEAGCIRNARGLIEVLDRAALEGRSCECYAVVRGEFERLLGAEARGLVDVTEKTDLPSKPRITGHLGEPPART